MAEVNGANRPSSQRSYCDVVMKGGITSGVVYPHAVCELAKEYAFKNVGGTSAGGIAAAATAAAELGRRRGCQDSFERVGQLPKELALNGRLLSMFQPTLEARPFFKLFVAAVSKDDRRSLSTRLLDVAFEQSPIASVFALLTFLGVAGVGVVAFVNGAFLAGTGWLLAAALALPIVILAWVYNLARRTNRAVTDAFYGMCTGLSQDGGTEGLTEWLTRLLDELACNDLKPLTFGDLWDAPLPTGLPEAGPRSINLELVTTCLTHGRPYRLPFEGGRFYFCPAEFRRLFPERIVAWLEDHAPADGGRVVACADPNKRLIALPDARDLPVVVATRMTLSFPVLISAVPLYAVDYTRKHNKGGDGKTRTAERCWFSDGGIACNFPVHFFDQMVPSWPTFAVNLRPFHPDYEPTDKTTEREKVWLPSTNVQGIAEWWYRFDEKGPSVFAFLGAIQGAMQNWQDNLQLKVPGYRDRIVHVHLTPDEGGLNLAMPQWLIEKLGERGGHAGAALRSQFGDNPPDGVQLTWLNHRWVRLRSSSALLEAALMQVLEKLNNSNATPSYEKLISSGDEAVAPNSYRLATGQREFIETMLKQLQAWRAESRASFQSCQPGAPRPEPELRIMPRF